MLAGIIIASAPLLADSARAVVAQGNALFEKGKFDEALQKYTRAQALKPNDPLLAYNVGDVLYRQKEYDKALEAFKKATAAPDRKLASAAYYNMGNCLFAKEDYAGAIEGYKQALDLDPEDAEAKFNLELARKKLKEQSKPQPQDNQQQQQQQDQQQQQGQQDQQKQDQKNQDQEKQKQSDQSDKSDQSDQKQQQQAMEKKQISEEEARRILDALKNKEKDEQKKQLQKIPGQAGRNPQDW